MLHSRSSTTHYPAVWIEGLESRRLMDGAVRLSGEASVSDQGLWDAMFATQIAESRAAEVAAASESVDVDESDEHVAQPTDDDIYGEFELWTNAHGSSESNCGGIVGEIALLPEVEITEVPGALSERANPNEPTDDDIYGGFSAVPIFVPHVRPVTGTEASSDFTLLEFEWASSATASEPGTEAVEIIASFADLSGLPLE